MRLPTLFRYVVVAIVSLLVGELGGAAARDGEKKTAPSDVEAPKGWILIEEDVWYQLADTPDYHFQEARLNYLHRDYGSAADEIEKAAATLKLAVAISPGPEKKPLQASILELETLAAEVGHAKVRSVRTFDRIFARAYLALANFNEAAARRDIEAKMPERAGLHLRAASVDIEQSLLWEGELIDDELSDLLIDAEKVAGKLIKGADDMFLRAIKTLDSLHTEYKELQEILKAAG